MSFNNQLLDIPEQLIDGMSMTTICLTMFCRTENTPCFSILSLNDTCDNSRTKSKNKDIGQNITD